jgi:hypothetical protein
MPGTLCAAEGGPTVACWVQGMLMSDPLEKLDPMSLLYRFVLQAMLMSDPLEKLDPMSLMYRLSCRPC